MNATDIKKLQFIFGDTAMSLTEADIDAICAEWDQKKMGREMTPAEFADSALAKLKASARPARTVLHN